MDQSVVLPEHLNPQESWRVHRNVKHSKELLTRIPSAPHISTLYENLSHSIASYPKVPCLGMRAVKALGDPKPSPYRWMTYAEVGVARTEIASGLLSYGIGAGSRVGLYSVNCADWVLVEAAALSLGQITVPLYDTLGPDAVTFISNHAELSMVACSVSVLGTLLSSVGPSVSLVLVYPDNGCPEVDTAALPQPQPGSNLKVVSLSQVRAAGRASPAPPQPPCPQDIATICYTSGTTGDPKGVVLTHENMIANCASLVSFTMDNVEESFGPGDCHISYLPLAHIYERLTMIQCLHLGVSIGFYRGDPLLLLDDIQALAPTLFISVPRLWNRIYDGVMNTIESSSVIQRSLFRMAFAAKKAALANGQPPPFIWEKLVFSKLRAKLGGRVRLMCSGASPISPEVMDFLRVCFAPTVEGYGMTEAACCISMTLPEDRIPGHVGAPVACCEVKLEDVPEMGYTHVDLPAPRGEICVRGPAIFQGYYKDVEQTREAIDADGWLHTGDIGTWIEHGRLKIIDRKKNIFKLQQGEYVSPEKIENVYVRCPLVAQSFVHGDSLTTKLVAIVVPDPEPLLKWAADRQIKGDVAALCKIEQVKEAVFKQINEAGKGAKLQGFEMVKAVELVPEMFSVENGLLTPTFKVKRPQLRARYQDAIDRMYVELGEK